MSIIFENEKGFKGQVYSRELKGKKEYYASTWYQGSTFKSLKGATKFMNELGYGVKKDGN
jgi:hypothetical protein